MQGTYTSFSWRPEMKASLNINVLWRVFKDDHISFTRIKCWNILHSIKLRSLPPSQWEGLTLEWQSLAHTPHTCSSLCRYFSLLKGFTCNYQTIKLVKQFVFSLMFTSSRCLYFRFTLLKHGVEICAHLTSAARQLLKSKTHLKL